MTQLAYLSAFKQLSVIHAPVVGLREINKSTSELLSSEAAALFYLNLLSGNLLTSEARITWWGLGEQLKNT